MSDVVIFDPPRNWRDRAIALGARWLVRPVLALPLPWAVHRAVFALAGRLRPLAEGITCESVAFGPRGGMAYRPAAPTARILWIHGGGFVLGSPRTHRGMLSHLARAANAVVLAPGYRLAPEHPFPAAVEDVEAAIDAIEQACPGPGPLILGGDSAGGALAMAGLAHALARDGPGFAGVMLASPAADLDPGRPVPEADDLLFPLRLLRRIGAAYAGGADPRDPRLSPVHGDYAGAPPVLIHCVRGEYLEADTDALAARLAAQGVPVRVEKYQRLPHVFHFMAGTSPAADAALERMADFVRARAGAARQP